MTTPDRPAFNEARSIISGCLVCLVDDGCASEGCSGGDPHEAIAALDTIRAYADSQDRLIALQAEGTPGWVVLDGILAKLLDAVEFSARAGASWREWYDNPPEYRNVFRFFALFTEALEAADRVDKRLEACRAGRDEYAELSAEQDTYRAKQDAIRREGGGL